MTLFPATLNQYFTPMWAAEAERYYRETGGLGYHAIAADAKNAISENPC